MRGKDWEKKCIGFHKSTSAGIGKVSIGVIDPMTRERRVINSTNKRLVGLKRGEDLFKRRYIKLKATRDFPASTGSRDVPYKMTRAIYVARVTTFHCQIPLTLHLQDYINTGKKKAGGSVLDVDAVQFSVGGADVIGYKLLDDMSTIAVSGEPDYLALDLDLSEFDAHNVWENFREPMLRAFRDMYRFNKDKFGNEEFSIDELIEYGYGDGYIHNSIWDNGRKTYFYSIEDYGGKKVEVRAPVMKKNLEGEITDLFAYPKERGTDKLDAGIYYFYDIEEMTDRQFELLLGNKIRVGSRMDGEDAILLKSEASGEFSTLFMNTVANIALQNLLINVLIPSLKIRNKLRFEKRRAVGDDMTIYFRILQDLNAQDVEELLDAIEEYFSSCGHKVSLEKTFLKQFKSDYRQSYAANGVMIPRDQIMLIPSERPRSLRNPDEFLRSRRRVYLSKISRGMLVTSAQLMFLYEMFMLGQVKNRFSQLIVDSKKVHRIPVKESDVFESWDADELAGGTFKKRRISKGYYAKHRELMNSLCRVYRREMLFTEAEERKKQSGYVTLRRSLLFYLIPVEAGGMGISPHCFGLYTSMSTFFSDLTDPDIWTDRIRRIMLTLLCFSMSLDTSLDLVKEGYNVKLDKGEIDQNFFLEKLFDPGVRQKMREYKDAGFSLGRLDGERSVIRGADASLTEDMKFNHVLASSEDMLFGRLVRRFSSMIVSFKCLSDEWILGLRIEYGLKKFQKCHSTAILNLDGEMQKLLEVFGIKYIGEEVRAERDLLRRLIASEPGLRNNISPEEVVSTCLQYGKGASSGHGELKVMMVVLERMGFNTNNSTQIAALIERNASSMFGSDGLNGAWSDDMFGLLNAITEDSVKKIKWSGSLGSMRDSIKMFVLNFVMYQRVKILLYGYRGRVDVDLDLEKINVINKPDTKRRNRLSREVSKIQTAGDELDDSLTTGFLDARIALPITVALTQRLKMIDPSPLAVIVGLEECSQVAEALS
jgi:hypothetical protein